MDKEKISNWDAAGYLETKEDMAAYLERLHLKKMILPYLQRHLEILPKQKE